MDAVVVRECGCEVCQQGEDSNVLAEHRRINVLLSRLDEQQRRWFVAHESQRLGFGGDVRMSQVTGLNKELVGNFANDGATWCDAAEEVNAHDFPQDAECRAVPYIVTPKNSRK